MTYDTSFSNLRFQINLNKFEVLSDQLKANVIALVNFGFICCRLCF